MSIAKHVIHIRQRYKERNIFVQLMQWTIFQSGIANAIERILFGSMILIYRTIEWLLGSKARIG
jgi:hypothetical protein